MTQYVDLYFYYGGKWKYEPEMTYVGGDVNIQKKFDVDFLSFMDIADEFKSMYGYQEVKTIYGREHGVGSNITFMLIENDSGIRNLLSILNHNSTGVDFYVGEQSDQLNDDYDDEWIHRIIEFCDTQSNKNPAKEGVDSGVKSGVSESFGVNVSEGVEIEGKSDTSESSGDEFKDNIYNVEDESEGSSDEDLLTTDARYMTKFSTDDDKPTFRLGMTFANALEVRAAVANYGIFRGVSLKYVKNEPFRIRVKCQEECPFLLFVSKDGTHPGMSVKTFSEEHNCFRIFNNSRCSTRFLASHFRSRILNKADYKVKDMKFDAEAELRCNVSFFKCKRARKLVLNEFNGRFTSEFSELEPYAAELINSNPGSVRLELNEDELRNGRWVFKRFFVCLDACKRGFKEACRPLIGLDGCFLKTKFKGELLVAVAKDAQDQNFPLAWACVNKETKVNWRWFLTLLAEALDLGEGAAYTYISDMQKGLVQAIIDIQPAAEHRWCARHIFANWSKKWRGGELRKKFWICSWSTYEEEFKDNLDELSKVSKEAAVDLMKYPPHTWCRALFSGRCKSMCVDNNMCESFNSWILEGRHKPIKSLMDYIRKKTMDRISSMSNVADKWVGNYSPACMEMFEAYKMATIGCNVLFNGDSGDEIMEGEDTHTVFLDKQLCTCRVWDLSGIPCQHAMCAFVHSKQDPTAFISSWYHKDTFKTAYRWKIQPMRGKKFWNCEKYQPIEPPQVESQPGRPKKEDKS